MINTEDNKVSAEGSFNFFINLFGSELNELVATKGTEGYQIHLDNETYLGTIAKNSDHTWTLIDGTIPPFIMTEITGRIDGKMNN